MANLNHRSHRNPAVADAGAPRLLSWLRGAGLRDDYVAWAMANGLRYVRDPRRHLRLDAGYELVRRCRDGIGVRHLCRGRVDGHDLLAFECRPTREDHGFKLPSRGGWHVALLRDLGQPLPPFLLLPNRGADRLRLGWRRLTGDVGRLHTVRGRHLLVGAAEHALRRLFDARVCALLDDHGDCTLESNGRELLAYLPLAADRLAVRGELVAWLRTFAARAARNMLVS